MDIQTYHIYVRDQNGAFQSTRGLNSNARWLWGLSAVRWRDETSEDRRGEESGLKNSAVLLALFIPLEDTENSA